MEHFLAFLFLASFIVAAAFIVVFLSNFLVSGISSFSVKNARKLIQQQRNKTKLLNAISTIYSANNSNTLNKALKDFRQSIKYHQTHNIEFLDKDLDKLNDSIEKFMKYKAFKLYGLDQQKSNLREYKTYLKQRSYNV